VKCSGRFNKETKANHPQRNNEVENITANIIFNLAHLGLSINDTKNFDLDTYFEIVELEMNVIQGGNKSRQATQSDIDQFLC
jgi:hypothetical protein